MSIDFYKDPLQPNTRQERRALLVAGILTIALCGGQTAPVTVSVGGVNLSASNQGFLFSVLFWTDLYFLVSFVSHYVVDLGLHLAGQSPAVDTIANVDQLRAWMVRYFAFWWIFRLLLDIGVPFLLGLYALWLAWHTTPVLPSYPIWTFPTKT